MLLLQLKQIYQRDHNMIDFYNAFISYRHAPLDSAIATHVQRKLEHFHVPHKLKKKLKRQKITRIFRDKDELPITSDLTETITEALEKADCLIVICSTSTKDSVWVKREISTFLKTHTRDKVLTVLCDGEPFDVIPEELLKTEKEFTDDNGFTHTVTVPVEPLSCDYRLPRSTADKEELPRLAAALLGCSYDELQRRSRQYRIRRTTAIVSAAFAALIGFGAYMAYTGKKINDSYIESLRTRSVYLANEAEQLLSEGKRLDALYLSVAALPGEDNPNMPVTAPAVRSIIDATCAYKNNHGAVFTPSWNYKADRPISVFISTDNCSRIAALDQSGNAYCWDTYTHELLLHKKGEYDERDILFLDDDTVIITYSDHIEAYNVPTNTLIWDYQVEDRTTFQKEDVVCADHAVFFGISNGDIVKLSGKDGSVLDTYHVLDSLIYDTVKNLAVSPDGKLLAFSDSTFIFNENDQIHIYNTETRTGYSNNIDSYIIWTLEFLSDGHLCVAASDSTGDMSLAFSSDLTFITDAKADFYCFDEKMNTCWSTEMVFADLSLELSILELPTRGAVLFGTGDTAVIYDIKTGEVKQHFKTGSSIMNADDFNDNGLPEFICRQGDYVLALNTDSNNLAKYSALCNDVSFGAMDDQLFAVQRDGTDIICYNRFLQDDEWTGISAYGGFFSGSSYQTSYVKDDTLVIAAKISDSHDMRISVIDMNKGKLVFTEDIPEVTYLSINFKIDCFEDELYGVFGYDIYHIDIENETVEKIDIQLEGLACETNGKIVDLHFTSSELSMSVMDLDGSLPKDYKPIEIGDTAASAYIKGAYYIESLDTVFVPLENRLFYADLSSSNIQEIDLSKSWNTKGAYSFSVAVADDGSKICFTDGKNLLVTDSSYEEIFSFHLNCEYRCSATFRDDILYVVADNTLSLYDATSGELLTRYEMSLYGLDEAVFHFDDGNNQLFIQTGDQISIFDTVSWTEILCIEGVYCYHPGSDRFYVFSYLTDSECSVGYIKNYSLDDLIEKAKTQLNGQEPSVDLRSKYGI